MKTIVEISATGMEIVYCTLTLHFIVGVSITIMKVLNVNNAIQTLTMIKTV